MNDTPIAEVSAASQAEGGHHRQGEHRPEHEQVAVREVDQLDDAVDERVAERDQGDDRAVRDADQQDLQQELQALAGVAARHGGSTLNEKKPGGEYPPAPFPKPL